MVADFQYSTANAGVTSVGLGDGVWDYKTCRNLGIRFIGIDVLQDGKLAAIGAEAVFKDFCNKNKILDIIF